MTAERLVYFGIDVRAWHPRVLEQVEIETKYQGYIERQRKQIDEDAKADRRILPPQVDYGAIPGMRNEAREKFMRVQPTTLGQAARIPGITPADIATLWVHVLKQKKDEAA